MSKNPKRPSHARTLLYLLLPAALLVLFFYQVELTITNRWEGVFLLKGRHGRLFELKDDIYLGDGHRLIVAAPLWWMKQQRSEGRLEKDAPCLYYEWDEDDGRGFVRNFLQGGRRISTSFSRYNYAQKQADIEKALDMHGLFVGGGLPAAVSSDEVAVLNETGMAYWDGNRWYHLWCSVNEGITPADTKVNIPPSDWKFLGSRVLKESAQSLAITSAHEIHIQGQRLRMDRFAYFRAGNTYFILSVWLKNEGDKPVSYYYTYGDEPWLGDFGSSQGNVGWVEDKLITNVQFVDTKKYGYAGFFDYGNKASHEYTWAANFIEWFGPNVPAAYFSNGPDDYPPEEGAGGVLTGDSRFIGLLWGPHTLAPGGKTVYAMAIGMAENDPSTGFPVKPEIKLKLVVPAR